MDFRHLARERDRYGGVENLVVGDVAGVLGADLNAGEVPFGGELVSCEAAGDLGPYVVGALAERPFFSLELYQVGFIFAFVYSIAPRACGLKSDASRNSASSWFPIKHSEPCPRTRSTQNSGSGP